MFFNLYTKVFDSTTFFQCSTVLNNILYLVVTEGYIANSIKLIKIDLVRMVEISSHTIDYKFHNMTVFKILGEELYCYTTLIDTSSAADDYINKNDVFFFNLITLDSTNYSIIGLRDIVMLNGKIC